ncbi:hypothetical protein SDRG_04361 [Saprolegnia diclina VS20]|uniref:Uncharacterized protein n=1 Tax=Saprolegnia diclina (strain VS20) TaxID=1156394 RepID=T0QX81_SAPDV|nr:hypothetical protein SDRG_04361 [Saprolegnia diclina VS20]EQC38665.1 hypothetical protein SDRG_04361 [Saprolegnia diclina VS20]|eukprot:XP_008608257.1 hypothetical protein SDRG_04361 [Saprolegnia diclina VS20]
MTTFNVRKGKWHFTCEVLEDALSAEAKANIETVYDLLSQDVFVTKRVSLQELRAIIDSSCSKVPEFYVSFANSGSFAHFNQFSTHFSSRSRAGVATISPDYWFILIPEGHLLKCMIAPRFNSPPTPETKAPPAAIEPIVPVSQLGLPEPEPLPVVDTTPAIATPTPAPKPKPMPIQDLTPNVLDAMLGLQQLHALSMKAPDEPRQKDSPARKETKPRSLPQTSSPPERLSCPLELLPCHPEPLPPSLAEATSEAVTPENTTQPALHVPEAVPQIPTSAPRTTPLAQSALEAPVVPSVLETPQRHVDKPMAASDNRPTDPRQNKRRRISTDALPPSVVAVADALSPSVVAVADALPPTESSPIKLMPPAVDVRVASTKPPSPVKKPVADYTELLRVHKCFHAMQYLVHGQRVESTKPRRSRHDRD